MGERVATSVVVALNHHEAPEVQVERFAAQTVSHDAFEVLLAGGPTHPAAESAVARAMQRDATGLRLRMVRAARRGRAAALNAALAEARAEVVLFLAGDGLAPPDLVERHVRFHADHPDPRVAAIGPFFFPDSLRDDPYRRWLEDSGRLFGVSFTRPDPEALSRFWYVGNTSVKRSLLDAAGPFDERCDVAGDDDDMARRLFGLGMRVTYLPDAVLEHDHPITLAERRRLVRQAGVAAGRLANGSTHRAWWHRKASHSSWTDARRALAARLASSLLGGDARRERFWILDADAAFASGFRSATRQLASR